MKAMMMSLLCFTFFLQTPCTVQAKDNEKETPPGLKKKNGVPPGLEKKGGLPPGQAKKRGSGKETPAPTGTETPTVKEQGVDEKQGPSLPGNDSPKPASSGEVKADEEKVDEKPSTSNSGPAVEEHATEPLSPTRRVSREMRHKQIRLEGTISSINELAKDPASRSAILRRLARQHRLGEETILDQQRRYPEYGLGDLYAANYIASKSGQPVPVIVARHEAGLGWGELATEHRTDLPQLLENSNALEQAARQAASRRRR